jgi:dTDP-4-amino-4,6-dideoxygalactose transaminase
MRRFRNHGIDSDHRVRQAKGTFTYDMVELGYNYRLPDVQCALGIAQTKRLAGWVARRQEIARAYDERLAGVASVRPLLTHPDRTNAHHLYVVRLDLATLSIDRARAFAHLRERGIGANIHYSPVYLHTFYRERFGFRPGLCPQAEAVYEEILTLPMYPALTTGDIDRVVSALSELAGLS